jgi:transcriptional regulator NrdR family protein
MYCPVCTHEKTSTECTMKGDAVHRLRKCLQCGFLFLSVEMINTDSRWNEYKNGNNQISEKQYHDGEKNKPLRRGLL